MRRGVLVGVGLVPVATYLPRESPDPLRTNRDEPCGNRMSFTGFGWTGEARAERPVEGIVITLESQTS